ncbi:MAG: hypothetical protein HY010_18345 [Acidobacteria bacterium]|nr:hypothetical protein [Acidobacteriota bacterium]
MSSVRTVANPAALNGHIEEVVHSAQHELIQLLRQRSELMKRIGTVKQTLVYLEKVFGDEVLTPEVLHLLGRIPARKQPGLTRGCRAVLMESTTPLEARQGLREMQRRFPGLIEHHKTPLASVTTVFNRLVASGEVRAFSNGKGRRVWEWIAESRNAADLILASTAEEDQATPEQLATKQ